MLKKTIKYTDFNDNETEDVFYFNISKTELVELEVTHKGGFEGMINSIMESKDNKAILDEFKRIILLSYGEKTPDGKSFIKNEDLRDAFAQTAAFEALFMEFFEVEGAAATFVNGIMPRDFVKAAKDASNTMPPPPNN